MWKKELQLLSLHGKPLSMLWWVPRNLLELTDILSSSRYLPKLTISPSVFVGLGVLFGWLFVFCCVFSLFALVFIWVSSPLKV